MDILLNRLAAIAQNWVILCHEVKKVLLQAKIGEIKTLTGQHFLAPDVKSMKVQSWDLVKEVFV